MPELPDESSFGKRLRAARKNAGLSQEATASQLEEGFSSVSQYRWENDKEMPSIAKVVRLADLYGVSIDWLVGRTPFCVVLRPGKVLVDSDALQRVRDLAESGGRLEDLPADLIRHPGIDYAWKLPREATVMEDAAAEGIEQQMQRLLASLRRRG